MKSATTELMTVDEVAKILGISKQAVRVRITRGMYKDFATCMKYPQRTTYDIYRARFYKFLGKENET